ncbi:auxilin-like clathrin-binding protein required for normal clathrin function [Elasticomyces elasticus]|nr:auxilin-like clathrin-binding protein required for normal clathrin function [Elasticomyces elasticus]
MDDLSGLSWSSNSNTNNTHLPKPTTSNSDYTSFRSTPILPVSGQITPQPISRPSSTLNGSRAPVKPSSPANDSFSGLLSLNSGKTTNNISLQDRQRQLLEERSRQQAQQQQLWETLGSGSGTPNGNRHVAQTNATNGPRVDEEDDILAAFKATAPVDASSHFPPPPPSGPVSGRNTPSTNPIFVSAANGTASSHADYDDDDPFGLDALQPRNAVNACVPDVAVSNHDEDDILGALSQPVAPKSPSRTHVEEAFNIKDGETARSAPPRGDPLDRAVAELVDMGFPADKSRAALDENGGSVQAAVGWLLNKAHEDARQKARGGQSRESGNNSPVNKLAQQRNGSQQRRTEDQAEALPSWMRTESRPSSSQRRQDSRSPASEKDVSQLASDVGGALFKSANSLWKTGQKRVQKVVAEFQQEGDASQPKWMRDASVDASRPISQTARDQHVDRVAARAQKARAAADMTDEAMMLEQDNARLSKPQHRTPNITQRLESQGPPLRGRTQAHLEPGPNMPRQFVQQQQQPDRRPVTKLSRHDVEEQTSQAYISPARRKRPTRQPSSDEVNLLDSSQPSQPRRPARPPSPPQPASIPTALAHSTKSAPQRSSPVSVPTRPKLPPRNIPPVSAIVLSASAKHRAAGTEAFKRGDYAAAHVSYTSALSGIPQSHPIAIVILSNRALTALKTGDPRAAVSDADNAMSIIGPSRGEGETIALGDGDGGKEMKDFYGKALMRKAEALEHMEKWTEAGAVWKQAVEAGVGGAVSIQGRTRCEKAAAGNDDIKVQAAKAAPARKPAPVKRPPAHTSTLGDLGGRPALENVNSTNAVRKLRAVHAAAEQVEDEKFALTDAVDARLMAWKGGKVDNLRALLASLDNILWPEAGWKKVGLAGLVMPNKVKIVYMKAIAKVHPDKIPQTATTEQRMISGAVFSTLNDAWDKFKRDNGL